MDGQIRPVKFCQACAGDTRAALQVQVSQVAQFPQRFQPCIGNPVAKTQVQITQSG